MKYGLEVMFQVFEKFITLFIETGFQLVMIFGSVVFAQSVSQLVSN